MNNYIKSEIDYAIKAVWMNEIPEDYRSHFLLKEDTLKNAFYFHLRNRIDSVLERNDLRIYTEFNDTNLKEYGFRADMAIVKLTSGKIKGYLGKNIEEVIAIIEFKYLDIGTLANEKKILDDFEKFKAYYGIDKCSNCQFYLANILEYCCDFDQHPNWLDKRSSNNWADGCVSELTAGRKIIMTDGQEIEKTGFYIISYNRMNKKFNYRSQDRATWVEF